MRLNFFISIFAFSISLTALFAGTPAVSPFVYTEVAVPSLPSSANRPALFIVYGLDTKAAPEEAYIWAYYLKSSWISYPMRDGIYQQPTLPVAYYPVDASAYAPAPSVSRSSPTPNTIPSSVIGYDIRGRAVYATTAQP